VSLEHAAPVGAFAAAASPLGSQNCCVHMPPGGVHVPQLALQHTWPAAHVIAPRCTGGLARVDSPLLAPVERVACSSFPAG
jgi:hypothetical protein